MRVILDKKLRNVGYEVGGEITPNLNTVGGRALAGWLRNGVPGLRGRTDGEMAVDEHVVIPPTEPLFGLALLEHMAGDLGWTVQEVRA